jgi:type IV secretory pathway TraG/TraD family ATPase VirD4
MLGKRADHWVWSGAQRSALILGPSRSGKTTTIIVPNVLCASAAVITTSTKTDVMTATAAARRRAGSCFVFDPMGLVDPPSGVDRIGWSPLRASTTWDGSLEMADAMVSASHRRARSQGLAHDHWSERSSALLSTLLFAASTAELDMAAVLQWTDRHQGEQALEILASFHGEEHPANALLQGILATDGRELSGIWSTSSGVLGAYRSLGALDATREIALDVDQFVAQANTLYVCAPGRQQVLLAPLVVGLLSEIQGAAYRRSDTGRPVLFALDELANIAPLPDLPQLVSEGGGQGVLTIGCLQDLSQARARWGREADGLLSLFSTTLLLRGITDMTTLQTLHAVAGQSEVLRISEAVNRDASGRRSHSRTHTSSQEPRLGIDAIAQGREDGGLLLDAENRLGWIQLSPAYRDEPWRGLLSGRFLEARDRSR